MTKRTFLPAVVAAIVALLTLLSVALGSASAERSAGPARISIRNLVSGNMSSDGTFKGRFKMVLDGVVADSGTSITRPNQQGALRVADGQMQTPVSGYNNLTSPKGTLSLSFAGVSVDIPNFDPTKNAFGVEYGAWKITGGTGIYKGWKGTGRWANASTATGLQMIDWAGTATH